MSKAINNKPAVYPPLRVQSTSPQRHPGGWVANIENNVRRPPMKTAADFNLYKMSIHEKQHRLFELYTVFGMQTLGGRSLYNLFGEKYRKQGLKLI